MENTQLEKAHEVFIDELVALLDKHCGPANHNLTLKMGCSLIYESIKVLYFGCPWANGNRKEFIKQAKSMQNVIADRFFTSFDKENEDETK